MREHQLVRETAVEKSRIITKNKIKHWMFKQHKKTPLNKTNMLCALLQAIRLESRVEG